MKRPFALSVVLVILLGLLPVAAQAARVPATNTNSSTSVGIPENAVQVAEHVFSLGTAVDPQSGKLVEGYAIVHPRDAHAKPDNPGNGNGGGNGGGGSTATSSCYTFLASGAKWKSVEPWVVNTANSEGLSGTGVFDILSGGLDKWEDAAGAEVFGNGSTTNAVVVPVLDGTNGVAFGSVNQGGAIAVTYVWGIFGGRPSGRELVEWDQLYDETDFDWSLTGEANKMDFDNIATHELGHSAGLGDLYESGCGEETMYGYGTEGEIQKRDLNAGDIAGMQKLY